MVFVVATVAEVPPGDLAGVAAAVGAYLVGTVLYVKTTIRERGSAGYRWASLAYHLVVPAVAVVAGWGPAVSGVFGLLLLRAALLPGRRLTPLRVGLIEMAGTLLVLAAVIGVGPEPPRPASLGAACPMPLQGRRSRDPRGRRHHRGRAGRPVSRRARPG
jgi:hypothetical protein